MDSHRRRKKTHAESLLVLVRFLGAQGIPVPKRGSSQSRVGRRGGNSNQPYGSTSSERQPLLNQQGSDNGYNTQYSQL